MPKLPALKLHFEWSFAHGLGTLIRHFAMYHNPHEPDEEADIDREIRIERMKREIEQIAAGKMYSGSCEPVSSRMEEAFSSRCSLMSGPNSIRTLTGSCSAESRCRRQQNSTITALRAKLRDIIRELGELRCFLHDTDHLSDRELYDWLWSSSLRDDTPDLSGMPDGAWHTSPIGAGNTEDTAIWLKYYATEEERRRWNCDYPSDIPAHEAMPFDRDRHLPKRAPF